MYALITGASSGIGREMAILLARRGYNLILAARREDRLEELKNDLIKKYNRKVLAEPCDLSVAEHCISLFEKYRKYPVTVLINNAGFGKVGSFTDIPLKTDLAMIKTNITAVHILTKLYADHMKTGRILNVASMAAFSPGPVLTTYSATKSYIFNLSLAVNYELKRKQKNVHITTLCPGPVTTEFNEVAGANMALYSISAKRCARIAINGLFRNKDLIIPSLPMKLLHQAMRITPYRLLLTVEHFIQTKKL